jgi:hypothetical protein
VIFVLLALALAQTPEGAPTAEPEVSPVEQEPEESSANDTIIVWGEGAIRHANEQVVRAMADLGYRVRTRKPDGTIVFKPPSTWKGRVALKEGMLDFRRPVVALWLQEPERETQYDAARTLDGQDAPQATGLRFVFLPSRRRLARVQATVLDGTVDEIRTYREVVQRTAGEDMMYVLPGRLDALWRDGAPLDGVSSLPSPRSRRLHALDFWATRAETPTGDRVRRALEQWFAEIVQASEHPLTAVEVSEAEGRAGRKLRLEAE